MSDWYESTLGQVCDEVNGLIQTGPFGSQLHQSDYTEHGVPVVMPKDIVGGRISSESVARVSVDHVDRLFRHKLSSGDIIYGRRGDIGRQALIRSDQAGWMCGTGCLRISLGESTLNPLFLHYYLSQDEVISWITNQAVGATMPNLNTAILRSVPVRYPDLPTQRRIADILAAYDDLIENSQRRIKILEEMARRLYREWFVHFRFPGHEGCRFVESPLGEIPEGWEVKAINQFATVITGKTPSKGNARFYADDVPFIKTPDMHGNPFVLSTSEKLSAAGAESQAGKTLPAGSICVSCIGTIGVVSITTERCQTNQQINSLVLNSEDSREFLYLRLRDAKKDLENLGANGATMGNVSKGKFEAMEILIPRADLLTAFHAFAGALFDEILTLSRQVQNLRRTRDLLLPRLLSGQIDVEALPEPALSDA